MNRQGFRGFFELRHHVTPNEEIVCIEARCPYCHSGGTAFRGPKSVVEALIDAERTLHEAAFHQDSEGAQNPNNVRVSTFGFLVNPYRGKRGIE